MAEFPNATTTGVRAGVTLTPSAGITISTAGAVVSGLDITGEVVITAPNVTLVDCRVTGTILIEAAHATIEYVDVIGRNAINAVDTNPDGHLGDGDNSIIQFCDISQAENGIWLGSDGVQIMDNYIHNLFSNTGSSDPHIDGIQVPGSNIGAAVSSNDIISHNNIDLDNNTANSCFIALDVDNVTLDGNRFSGGSYVVYFLGNSSATMTDNTFAEFTFGYLDAEGPGPFTFSGNVDANGNLLPFNGTIINDTGPDELTLRVSEDAWLGDAQFIVTVNGHQLGDVQTVTASHAAGQSQTITLLDVFDTDISQVAVEFINDAWGGTPDTDRNLYVDQLTINGHVFQGENAFNQAGVTVGDSAGLFGAGSLIFDTGLTASAASVGDSSQVAQLVQAMAAFDGGNGSAESSNAPPLGADTPQQTFLTPPPA